MDTSKGEAFFVLKKASLRCKETPSFYEEGRFFLFTSLSCLT
ncbi:hypothetical protein [Prevotella sp.]